MYLHNIMIPGIKEDGPVDLLAGGRVEGYYFVVALGVVMLPAEDDVISRHTADLKRIPIEKRFHA